MENISKDMDELFWNLQEKYSINEYVEISTCNRKEYYISNQWVGHETEEKKNLRINDFAMAIYQDSGYRFFVDFVKKNTSICHALVL